MTESSKIENLVREYIKGTGIFLVEVKVSRNNDITVFADTLKGITVDECAGLNMFLENNLDREEEDFSLQVSSPGIGHPFRVKEQYYKSEGRTVAVTLKNGLKHEGILRNVSEDGFFLDTGAQKKGKNKSVKSEGGILKIDFSDIKTAKEIIIYR
ncbi:MAG TPA: hypothetical protein P5257_05145 [Bacteroidales bacterium]|nr:hypothetical protein [Bacteroidales bacterium]HRR92706.1 hypothetical protein [Bacteroidales bacterium]HRT89488.1 hypothetical protein [Bacteroidales bacterium]